MRGILITGLRTILHNTLRCVERAGLEITDIALQPLAAGSLVLSKDEKRTWCGDLSILAEVPRLWQFSNKGCLQYTSVIPIGGETLTRDAFHRSKDDYGRS